MGNKILTLCGNTQDKYELLSFGKRDIEMYKKQENLEKIKMIQKNFRTQKSLKILKENLNDYEQIFDSNLNVIGEYIGEEELHASIDNNVREIENMLGPIKIDDDYKNKFKNVFMKNPIKFTEEGTIYKGNWNYQGKKHGYGILITKEGSKYEGFWKNDQLEGIGRFIEIRGNYYDGMNKFLRINI